MKIVYLISNIRKCGPLNVMNQIIYNMKNDDISVISIFGDRDNHEIIGDYKKNGVKVYSLNLNKKNYILKGKKQLKKIIEEINPDVINSHGIIPDLLICNLQKFYRVSTIHSNIYEDYLNRFGKIKGIIFIKLHEKALKKIDKKIAVSKFISEKLIQKGIKSNYIRNGVEIEKIDNINDIKKDVKKELKVPENSIMYVFCGSLYTAKGVKELVEMFNHSHEENEYLIIMGNGPERESIEKIKDDHVKMLGHTKNVIRYYAAADIYISNSKTEGFSMAMLEALNAENLLLLSDIPSHRECMDIDKNIYLGEIYNKDNFEEKKEKVKKSIGKFDKRIIPKISAKRMADEYKKIYRIKRKDDEKWKKLL